MWDRAGRSRRRAASNVVRLETTTMIPKRAATVPAPPPVLTPVFRYDAGRGAAPDRMRMIGIGVAVLAIAAVFVPRLLG